MLGSLCVSRHWTIGMLAVIISAMVVLGRGASAAQNTSLYSLVPLDCPVTASVDVPWVWKTTANLRSNAMVGMGLQAAEKALGVSIEKDVLPWAGQAGFALTDVRNDGMGWALFLQIRDAEHMMGTARVEALLQTILEGDTRGSWKGMEYKGVAIRRTEYGQGRSVLKVAMATVDGWLVISFGDGVIRKVIDTHNGDTPSLATHPSYTRAMGELPTGAVAQFCVNGQGILAQIQQNDADAARQLKDTELAKFFLAGTMTYPDDTLLCDAVYCTTSPTTQATLKQLRIDAGTVSGASLAQQPAGTFATLLIRNPDKWVGAVEQLLLDSFHDADAQQGITQAFSGIDGLRAVLKRCSGEVGVGVAWREGKGFGVTVAGETGTADEATAAATDFSSFLEKQHVLVDKKDSLYTMPETKGDQAIFSTLLCWTTRQQWLVGASHPDWVTPPAVKPSLALPASDNNANLVMVGDYSVLPQVLKSMGVDDAVLANFASLKFGQWDFTMKIDEDGGAVRSHTSGGVVPVIATSAAVFFPVIAKAREKARTTTSISNLRQLAIAALMYAQEHDEKLPAVKTAADIKKLLNVPDAILISPLTGEAYAINPSVSGKALGTFDKPEVMIVFYEKTPEPDGARCAAFLDGHAMYIPASEWNAAKRLAKIP